MATKSKYIFTVRIIVVTVGLLMLIVLAGIFFYKQSSQSLIENTYNHLETITEIKKQQFVDWFDDEKYDAKIISKNPFLQECLFSYIENPNEKNKKRLELFLQNIENEHGLLGIYVINDERKVLIETKISNEKTFCGKHAIRGDEDSVMHTVIHFEEESKTYAIDFLYPIQYKGNQYFIVYQNNVNSFIFPLVSLWNAENSTAETVIIQKEADSVFVLNIRKYSQDSIPYKVPMFKTYRASVQAAMGKTGRIQAVDYRNKNILAYISKIPGTDWAIMSKMDTDDVYASIHKNAGFIILFIILIIAFIVFAFAFIYANKQRKMFKSLYRMQRQFKTTLYSIGDGVITTDSKGRVQYMNPIAEELTGWKESEAQGKQIEEVFEIIHEYTRAAVENPVHKVLQQCSIVGLANHTLLVHKITRKEIPIADSGVPILTNDNELQGVVLVFRDQSEEYARKKQLEQTNQTLTTLISNLPGITYSCKNCSSWDMMYISDACSQITGYSKEDFIENHVHFRDIIHPDDRQMVFDVIQNSIAQHQKFRLEYRILSKNNDVVYVWEQGQGVYSESHELLSVDGYIVDITHIKLNEIELASSKQLLHTILDTIPVSVFWKNKDLQYAGANINFLRDTNTTLQDIYGKTDFELPWADNAKQFTDIDKEVIASGIPKFHYEEEIVTESLQKGWLKTSKIPLLNEKGEIQGILGMYENITEQKRMLQELKEREELYRMQFEEHNAIKIILDPETNQIVNVNKAAVETYGWSKEEFLQMSVIDLDALGAETLIRVQESRQLHKKYFETIHKKADGSCMDVEVYWSDIVIKNKNYVHNIVHDITEKKRAENKLKLQIRAIEQSPVSIVITNNNGIIEYVNPKFSQITGYTYQEAIGQKPSILKSGAQTDDFYKELWNTIVLGQDWSGEILNKRKNGELFWEQALISPIVNEKNEVTHYVAVKEDITEKKQMLEDLIAAKEKAEESDTLKTAFLANMSHEIRTPMNGIIGFSEMLAENNLTDEKRKEYAQIVVKSSKQLLALVNDILDISKIEAGEVTISKDIFNVNTLIHDIYIFFKPQAIQKRLEFHEVKSLADSQSVIESDKNRLRQILVNLVSNALKFTHTGEVSFGYSVSNGSITFFVKDTGIGIPKHLQKEIFERFRQAELETTKLYGGTGLGLSISQKLVELLGGTIQLESEPGKGSLFSFTLPYKQEKSNDEIVSQPIGNINFNKATIVIAEDNDTNFQLLEATLSKCNLTIIRAVNGQDAIDICMQNSAVQFVLMDIRMPKIDGITASAEIKKYRPDLPIVIQSAYKANEERKQAIEAGCDEYLSKPIKKHELISCLLRFIPI